jgi:methyl-galactoside transport system permease protein
MAKSELAILVVGTHITRIAMSKIFFTIKSNIVDWLHNLRQRWADFWQADKATKLHSISKFLINYALVLFIIVYVLTVAIINPRFVNLQSIVNILTQGSLLLMVSLGMAGIIVLTGADLSASSIVFFVVAVVTTLISNNTTKGAGGASGVYLIEGLVLPLFVALIVAMILGGAIGSLNGTLTAKFKVHPFIGTMAINFIFSGSALTLLYLSALGGQGTSVQVGSTSPIVTFVNGGFSIGNVNIPNIIWFALLAVLVLTIVWNKTRFGKNMFAVGCNPEAARVAGVNVTFVTISVFALAGIMYGYAAFFGIGYNWGGAENSYSLLGLYAIASCVIGGVSFTGGVGRIRGVVFGVLLFQLIRNSTSYVGLSSAVGNVFVGVVVAFAVVFDMLKYRIRS